MAVASPTMAHTTSITVRFADLDPYDHVNHARYLTYFESARVEMLSQLGFGMDVMKRDGFQIVLVEISAEFHAPAGLHDELLITTEVEEVRRASSRWRQKAHRGEELIASLAIKAAFTDQTGRPRRAPAGFLDAVNRVEADPRA